MTRLATVFLAVVALLSLVAPVEPAVAAPTVDPVAAESDFVAEINALRASKGLGPLEVHPELTAIARRWAASMAKADEIAHNRNFSKSVQADWEKLGENVGVGMSVGKLHTAFVNSPAHYRNLVDPAFTYVGVGVVVGRDGALFTAHQFMQLRGPTTGVPSAEPSARMLLVLQLLRELDAV